MIAANTMAKILESLRQLSHKDTAKQGTVVIGTVKGDLHDIGKNL